MRKILFGVVIGALMVPAVATAAAPNIFGGPGTAPKLNADCSRAQMYFTPAGKTWAGAQPNGKTYVFKIATVLGGQVKCLIHRVNRLENEQPPSSPPPTEDTCWQQAGEVPKSSGIALRNYLDKVQDCETGEVEGTESN